MSDFLLTLYLFLLVLGVATLADVAACMVQFFAWLVLLTWMIVDTKIRERSL